MVEREFYPGTWQQDRSFSPAVSTRGGRTIWLAGHAASVDENGKPFVGDFAGQVHRTFAYMKESLSRAGGTLEDIVTMTVFVIDSRYGREFVDIRKQYFAEDRYPASMLITCSGFAQPNMMVEIQAIAVVDD